MLHVLYRYTALENAKPRPAFYSKAVCLESFLHAARELPPAAVNILSDGPLDETVLSVLAGAASVRELSRAGLEGSFLLALELASAFPPDDWIYLIEDDYFHLPDALKKLEEAADAQIGDYLTLFDDPLRYHRTADVAPDLPVPAPAFIVTRSHHWRTIESTTFTFAARAGTIHADLAVFREHVERRREDASYVMDREAWRELQGLGSHVVQPKRRRLFGAIPALATHLETTSLSPTIDWSREAGQAATRVARKTAAIHGHGPVSKTIPLPPMPGALSLGKEEEYAVVDVVRSRQLGRFGGPENAPSRVLEFEQRFATHIGTAGALAVSSGTAALHAALVGLEIGPGDEVIVPAYTWVGTATTVCVAGAVPVIADIDASLTLDPSSVESLLSTHTRAIIAVHMRGAPARMQEICCIAERHRLLVIEDVAQAMGGSYRGQCLGTIGDAGCFSLQTYKILTVGEGGLVVARDPATLLRMVSFHGSPSDAASVLSLNFRMNEFAGAVGCAQLDRLEAMLARMRAAKGVLRAVLRELAVVRPIELRTEIDPAGDASVSVSFFAETPEKAERIHSALAAEGIGTFRYYRPGEPDLHVYRHWDAVMNQRPLSARGGPWRFAHRNISYTPDMCPRALDLLARGIDITILPQLTEEDVDAIAAGLRKVVLRYA